MTGSSSAAPAASQEEVTEQAPAAPASFGKRILGGPDLEGWLEGQPEEPALLPHLYGKVKLQSAPRFSRLPTAEEEKLAAAAAAGKGSWPSVVKQRLEGVFLVAVDREEEQQGRRYFRTVAGRYLRQADLDLKQPPRMHGEFLKGAAKLPLAFVFGEDRPVYRRVAGDLVDQLVAKKHSRFHVEQTFVHQGERYVEGPRGMIIPADAVRVARVVARPKEIPADAKWIHVDLSQQALVAYEGSKPLFATLVSSGRRGYEPPTGIFRVESKHIKTTMDGPDPTEGWYEVQEVPWTMYYHRGFALHGAYWHDQFGEVRSHGCTNIAPADARWLFLWADPRVPDGWRSYRSKNGTHVYFTD